jgi:hypothetical protein
VIKPRKADIECKVRNNHLDSQKEQHKSTSNTEKREHASLKKIGFFVAILALIATLWQVYIASDNEIQTLRAYILPSSGRITVGVNNMVDADIIVKNFGSTPAYDFRYWACAFDRKPPARNADFPDIPANIDAPPTVVPPQSTKGHPITVWCEGNKGSPISEPERAAIRDDTKEVYIVGVMRYKDVFGFNRVTKYRFRWTDKTKDIYIDDNYGNCADEGCELQPIWKNIIARFWRFGVSPEPEPVKMTQ